MNNFLFILLIYFLNYLTNKFGREVFFGLKKDHIQSDIKNYRREAKFFGYFNHKVGFDIEIRL